MSPPPPSGRGPDDGDRRAAADRAGRDYWRDVARQRRAEAARVQRRPMVRVAIAVDRRTAAAQSAAGRVAARAGQAARRVPVLVGGWRHRAEREGRRRSLDALRPPPAPEDDRPVLVVHLGPAPTVRPGRPVTWLDLSSTGPPHSAATSVRIDAAVQASDAPLVCLLGPHSRPRDSTWLDRLTAPLGGSTVATAPLVVHPDRPLAEATPDDQLVRNAGLDLALGPHGLPVVRARAAGASPRHVTGGRADTASGAGLALLRDAWPEAGLPAADGDLDAAVVDLCLRLAHGDGTVHLVPEAIVEDHGAVLRAAQLAGPVADDGRGWLSVVEAHGPTLVRRAHGDRAPSLATITLTTATPSRKMAHRSGDWLFAGLFADALRRQGHQVRVQTADEADDAAGRVSDVHIVLRGLEPVRRTAGQGHVLWVISHPEALDVEECDQADLVLVASERFAAHLRERTATPVEVLLQATEPRLFRPRPVDPAHAHEVTVVAASRGVRRRAVTDALAAGLRPAVYGWGWEGLIEPALVVAPYVAPSELPVVYSSAGLVLNDHWDTMAHEGFVSNRIFDVLACGTTVVSDHLPEVDDLFGGLVPTWRSPEELGAVVADVRTHPEATEARTAEARALVLDAHTFDHRVTRLAHLLGRHGVGPPRSEEG